MDDESMSDVSEKKERTPEFFLYSLSILTLQPTIRTFFHLEST